MGKLSIFDKFARIKRSTKEQTTAIPETSVSKKYPLIEITTTKEKAVALVDYHRRRGVNAYVVKIGKQYVIKPRTDADLKKALSNE